MLAAVIDTNIFISGLLKGSSPSAILDALRDNKFRLLISPELLDEVAITARKPRLARIISPGDLAELLDLLNQKAFIIEPKTRLKISRDPKDDMLIECALEGNGSLIVTRDRDLLDLKEYGSFKMILPEEFTRMLSNKRLSW